MVAIAADPERRGQVDDVLRSRAIPEFKWFAVQKAGVIGNNWIATTVVGNFGEHVAIRTAANYVGIWNNARHEVVYFVTTRDEDCEPLDGSATYVLDLPAGALPGEQVNAYWSLSLVDIPGFVPVANRLDRYTFNSIAPPPTEDDGSLRICLAPESGPEAPEARWLPTPAGRAFSLTFRTYVPKDRPRPVGGSRQHRAGSRPHAERPGDSPSAGPAQPFEEMGGDQCRRLRDAPIAREVVDVDDDRSLLGQQQVDPQEVQPELQPHGASQRGQGGIGGERGTLRGMTHRERGGLQQPPHLIPHQVELVVDLPGHHIVLHEVGRLEPAVPPQLIARADQDGRTPPRATGRLHDTLPVPSGASHLRPGVDDPGRWHGQAVECAQHGDPVHEPQHAGDRR